MLTIKVTYSCFLCGLEDREVEVPARLSQEEGVKEWMDQTIQHLVADHQRVSPHCHPKQLHNLKIPLPDSAGWVGGAPLQ